MNRVMEVELAMLATLPGLLVGLHYAVQILRPHWGHASDVGGRRTPYIVRGIAILALGAITASGSTAWMNTNPLGGVLLAMAAFVLVGVGVGVAGTSLLALLAARVDANRRAAAASTVWLMMIFGFIITAGTAGHFLDPFSFERLVVVTSTVAGLAFALTVVATWGVEPDAESALQTPSVDEPKPRFKEVLAEVWAETKSRTFTIFVFVSMLAYSTQDLILEPFAGAVFGLTPGQSTQLAGVQHQGVFIGMVLVGFAASGKRGPRFGSIRSWTVGGCLASGTVLFGLAIAGFVGPSWPIRPTVFALGLATGAFAVAAIGWMMSLAGDGKESREGIRMGLWGGAQAVAFALGGVFGTIGVDVTRFLYGSTVLSYSMVFAVEATLFVFSAILAARMEPPPVRGDDWMPAELPTSEPAPAHARVAGATGD
jgi:BCD family chlorophyll transporter-like MFS transporter